MENGYEPSSEEQGPNVLVEHARAAEEAGFGFAFYRTEILPRMR